MKRKVLFAALLLYNLFAFSQQWVSVGEGVMRRDGAPCEVYSLMVDTDLNELYVHGCFDSTGTGLLTGTLLKWNSNAWSNLGVFPSQSGPSCSNQTRRDIYIDNKKYGNGNNIVVVNYIHVMPFTGTFIGTATADVNDLCWWNGKLVAVGDFAKMNGVTCNGIAVYDTTTQQWSSLGAGMTFGSTVNCCYNWNGKLVIGGIFGQIDGVNCNSVAMYDTTNGGGWHSLGGGIGSYPWNSGQVFCFEQFNNELYVGCAGNPTTLLDLYKFNGTNWVDPLPPGSIIYDVMSMIVFHQKLILVSQDYPGILEFDGTVLDSALASLNGGIYSLAVYNDELIAGGSFITNTQGDTLNRIARWSNLTIQNFNPVCENDCNGIATVQPIGPAPYHYQWNTPNADTTQTVNNLCPGTYQVIVTDSFGQLHYGTVIINNTDSVAISGTHTNASCASCANGSAGLSISSGTPPYQFLWSTGDTTSGINNQLPGTYTVCVTDSNGCVLCDTIAIGFVNGISPTNQNSISIKPNPANNLVYIRGEITGDKISLINTLGQIIEEKKATSTITAFNTEQLSNGVYFIVITNSDGVNVERKKLVKL